MDSTIVGVLFVPVVFTGHNIFMENKGTAIEVFWIIYLWV